MTRLLSLAIVLSPLAMAACTTGHAEPLAVPAAELPAYEQQVDLAGELDFANRELAVLRSEMALNTDNTGQVTALQQDLSAAQGRVGSLSAQMAAKDARIATLAQQLQQAQASAVPQSQLDAQHNQLAKAVSDVERLQNRVERLRNRNNDLAHTLSVTEQHNAGQVNQLRDQRAQLRSLERALRHADQAVASSRALERRLSSSNAQVQSLQTALDQANRRLARANTAPSAAPAADPRVASLQTELARLRTQNASLRAAQNDATASVDEAAPASPPARARGPRPTGRR